MMHKADVAFVFFRHRARLSDELPVVSPERETVKATRETEIIDGGSVPRLPLVI